MTGPMGCSKLLASCDITNFKDGTRSSKKNWPQVCEVRQGLQGMGCSKLLAEGGGEDILISSFLIGAIQRYGKVQKKSPKIGEDGDDPDEKHFIFTRLFICLHLGLQHFSPS